MIMAYPTRMLQKKSNSVSKINDIFLLMYVFFKACVVISEFVIVNMVSILTSVYRCGMYLSLVRIVIGIKQGYP